SIKQQKPKNNGRNGNDINDATNKGIEELR
ncbi:MAG: hypothetical protein ACI9IJ_000708, partial [Psychromonas sp.]